MKTCLFCGGVAPIADVKAIETDAGIVFHVELKNEGGLVVDLQAFKTPCKKHQAELNELPIIKEGVTDGTGERQGQVV
jgi:hypothetical protein